MSSVLRAFRSKRNRAIVVAVGATAVALVVVLMVLPHGGPMHRVYGTVTLREGDCGLGGAGCQSSPFSTTVYVRKPVPLAAMGPDGSSYLERPTELVLTMHSNETGFFEGQVAEGVYSVFANYGGREFCNYAEGTWMCPLVVGTDPVEINVTIDHAVY